MGYKLKTGKTYKNGIGIEMPDAYFWVDDFNVNFKNKTARLVLKSTATKEASEDGSKILEKIVLICNNHKEINEDGDEIGINDFDDYIGDFNDEAKKISKKRLYEFVDYKLLGSKKGNFVKDDWESDE